MHSLDISMSTSYPTDQELRTAKAHEVLDYIKTYQHHDSHPSSEIMETINSWNGNPGRVTRSIVNTCTTSLSSDSFSDCHRLTDGATTSLGPLAITSQHITVSRLIRDKSSFFSNGRECAKVTVKSTCDIANSNQGSAKGLEKQLAWILGVTAVQMALLIWAKGGTNHVFIFLEVEDLGVSRCGKSEKSGKNARKHETMEDEYECHDEQDDFDEETDYSGQE